MFYQKIAEISYNRAFLSFFGPGQDDLAAAFLVCDGQKFYRKMTRRTTEISSKRSPGAGRPETDAHSRCDQVSHRLRSVAFKDDMGSKASFHKIAVCDLADGLGTAKADIIGIFCVC